MAFVNCYNSTPVAWRNHPSGPRLKWRSRALEWQLPTPVPVINFARIPVITGGPYDYGDPGAPPVADLGPAVSLAAGD